MRVLLVSPYRFPEGGGLERYADALSAHLVRAGHDVTQLAFARYETYEYERGFRRITVPYAMRVSNTPVGLRMHRAVKELLRKESFDLVNGHTPVPGAAESAAFAAWRARTPFVVTYHAGRLSGGRPLLDAVAWAHRGTLERFMLERAAARVAVSPYVQSAAFGGGPCSVVPPGVDTSVFHERVPAVPGRVLFVGRVSRAYAWKGFDVLYRAFEWLARGRPDAHLRVVGEGDLVEHYRARAAAAGLERRVLFGGRVDDERLAYEYSRAAVVALPSLTDAESFGMTLAEANACGRPVVGSRVGGIPHFVRDGENGLLVSPGNARELADAIGRLLSEPDLARRLGEAGRERVHCEHQWRELAGLTVEAFEGAARRAG